MKPHLAVSELSVSYPIYQKYVCFDLKWSGPTPKNGTKLLPTQTPKHLTSSCTSGELLPANDSCTSPAFSHYKFRGGQGKRTQTYTPNNRFQKTKKSSRVWEIRMDSDSIPNSKSPREKTVGSRRQRQIWRPIFLGSPEKPKAMWEELNVEKPNCITESFPDHTHVKHTHRPGALWLSRSL